MEKPILFNTDMVRAILDERKTVTRRLIKPQPETFGKALSWKNGIYSHKSLIKYAQYQIGDTLYVRETYCPNYFDKEIMKIAALPGNRNAYKADYHKENIGDIVPEPKWTPSIHMPKQAARIWLKVTNVKVDRLQDMYVDDAIKEGAWGGGVPHIPFSVLSDKYPNSCNAVSSFAHIWDSTIKKSDIAICGWKANPFVWVIEFERCEKPEQGGTDD